MDFFSIKRSGPKQGEHARGTQSAPQSSSRKPAAHAPQQQPQRDPRDVKAWLGRGGNTEHVADSNVPGWGPSHQAAQSQLLLAHSVTAQQGMELQPDHLDRMQQRISLVITSLDDDEDASKLSDALQDELEPSSTARSCKVLPQLNTQDRPRNFVATIYFSKVWGYSNARLPQHLPPFRVYLPTMPLICTAARYSLSAYSSSHAAASSVGPCRTMTVHVPPNLRMGTKAMVFALAPCTSSSTPTLVIAIRGSATFSDWAVNFRPAPASPEGFLDDDGNLVHSGFLHVARSTIEPMAQQLQEFLFSPVDCGAWRDKGQLLFTGHSAGGAVAALLFCHITSQADNVQSPLRDLRAAFKRVHCMTFGSPPISLLPLERPKLASTADKDALRRWKKNLFYSFINEGDPVVRADRASIKSSLELYRAPAPVALPDGKKPIWPVPQSTMSNAGRLVLLRPVLNKVSKRAKVLGLGGGTQKPFASGDEKIEAVMISDEQLRAVVFGDPMVHSMRLYKQRVDALAVHAVTGGGPG